MSSQSSEQCYGPELEQVKFGGFGLNFFIGSDTSKHIDMLNALIENQVLNEGEMKKVGFTLYEQEQQKNAPRGHSRPNPGLEIKGP